MVHRRQGLRQGRASERVVATHPKLVDAPQHTAHRVQQTVQCGNQRVFIGTGRQQRRQRGRSKRAEHEVPAPRKKEACVVVGVTEVSLGRRVVLRVQHQMATSVQPTALASHACQLGGAG